MTKNIDTKHVRYVGIAGLELGDVTPDGIVLHLDLWDHTYYTPLGPVEVDDPETKVPILARVTLDMVDATIEAVRERRPGTLPPRRSGRKPKDAPEAH